jgi:hypothetical protein
MKIPSLPKYDITLAGKVRKIEGWELIEEKRNKDGLRSIVVHNRGHKQTKVLARLVLQTFRPFKHGEDDDWFSVKYIDGDQDNIHASNLLWDNSIYEPTIIPGVTHSFQTWVPVYGRPELEIKIGLEIEFRSSQTNNSCLTHVKEGGYLTVQGPDGKYWDVHRLIALTFLKHPHDVHHLTVNHKDSDKLNNALINLEWVNQSENIQHALSHGNRSNSPRTVIVKSLEDGRTIRFGSIQSTARFLEINPGHVHNVCAHGQRRGLGLKGYLVKFEDDPISWDEMILDVDKNKESYHISVKNMISGEVVKYDSLMQTVAGEHINPKTVYRLLQSSIMIPWNGKCFQTTKENMSWPNYPKEIVEVYLRVRNSGRPFKVTYPDGKTEYSAGVTEWVAHHSEYKTSAAVLNRAINRGALWQGIEFEYIDLTIYQ